ncbi:MAG: NAD-dependent epimerase/dehydratase family protein [Chloroflexi bacterium]|nr:NAD-dependent epimerase/dehydratase family protein [Chloroflexota bacterium]
MKILLTGSSGTIGTRLFERINGEHQMVGVDKRPNKWSPAINEKTVITDLRDRQAVKNLPGDIDLVIHFAANARVYELVKEPDMALDNILMVYNVLEYARRHRIPGIIFASSREVYGNIMADAPIKEGQVEVVNCESPYSASKLSGEAMMQAYGRVYGIRQIIVRFSNVYGMYDDSDRVIPLWGRQMTANQDITVFGREKVLDFTYIDDAVDAVISLVSRFDRVAGNTFNIASGEGVRLYDVAEKMKKLFNARSGVILRDNRPGEVWKFRADISKAVKLLDYHPQVKIDEGLRRTADWYRQNS